jgi:DNA repair protein RadC
MPRLQDKQLIKHLLSGLDVLETTLLDYIIIGGGTIFSANEAGIIENKKQKILA